MKHHYKFLMKVKGRVTASFICSHLFHVKAHDKWSVIKEILDCSFQSSGVLVWGNEQLCLNGYPADKLRYECFSGLTIEIYDFIIGNEYELVHPNRHTRVFEDSEVLKAYHDTLNTPHQYIATKEFEEFLNAYFN